MRIIYRYQLDTNPQDIELHEGYRVVSCQLYQTNGQICVWIECENTNPKQIYRFNKYASGREIPVNQYGAFLGTVQVPKDPQDGGGFITWHVYEGRPKPPELINPLDVKTEPDSDG
ncbi:MAG TPA: hypothetical protein VF077_09040 [Nitrospiraceae bacterium]